jgi:aldehyde dehydrogenase (NAD+)
MLQNTVYPGASTGLEWFAGGEAVESLSPADGRVLGAVRQATGEDLERVLAAAEAAFPAWRMTPAPRRGEIVRQFGLKLREHKRELGEPVSLEMGKILQEGMGEVQEMIDICDFAVGLSRQLYGLTIASERPGHRMMEQYHPLGIVGVITAFNFPVAVWSWNAMVAAVCGDVIVWKPSGKVPLCAVAVHKLMGEVLKENGLPEGIFNLVVGGGKTVGEALLRDPRVNLVSFTGSTGVGRHVSEVVSARFGRTILELGGNNAVIVAPSADMGLVIPGIVFGAAGTTGQRCTTIRRAIIHESVFERTASSLVDAYSKLKVGDPLDEANHVGPMIDRDAVRMFQDTIRRAVEQGGKLLIGGEVLPMPSGCYVRPAIVEMRAGMPILREENFCPALYLIPYSGDIEEAIRIQNDSAHGLSSAIFTNYLREAELFLSAAGSDCGIANVNIGTSGAEIGGAFGGEKETGGGRESGSDAWKAYMRRQTATINYSKELPLSQGIEFKLD